MFQGKIQGIIFFAENANLNTEKSSVHDVQLTDVNLRKL